MVFSSCARGIELLYAATFSLYVYIHTSNPPTTPPTTKDRGLRTACLHVVPESVAVRVARLDTVRRDDGVTLEPVGLDVGHVPVVVSTTAVGGASRDGVREVELHRRGLGLEGLRVGVGARVAVRDCW